MKTYKPGYVKDADLRRELESLVQAAHRSDTYVGYVYLTAEPDRPFAGMEVLADGVAWNPGSGEGKYRRNLANTAWVHLG